MGITRKKNTIEYSERNEQKREEFVSEIEVLPEDSELYYVDESDFDEYYWREYGYAPRGEKVVGKVSGRRFAFTPSIFLLQQLILFASSFIDICLL